MLQATMRVRPQALKGSATWPWRRQLEVHLQVKSSADCAHIPGLTTLTWLVLTAAHFTCGPFSQS